MINTDDKHLLMIEPQSDATAPVDDDLTEVARMVFGEAKPSNVTYKGWHTCVCGKRSDSKDWILPNGMTTNSLMVHYIESHRNEVPDSEIEKLRSAFDDIRVRNHISESVVTISPQLLTSEDRRKIIEEFKRIYSGPNG